MSLVKPDLNIKFHSSFPRCYFTICGITVVHFVSNYILSRRIWVVIGFDRDFHDIHPNKRTCE